MAISNLLIKLEGTKIDQLVEIYQDDNTGEVRIVAQRSAAVSEVTADSSKRLTRVANATTSTVRGKQ